MAKAVALISALCILAIATGAHAHGRRSFHVEGDVYCDPCLVEFETELSQRLTGAVVRLECVHRDTKALTYSVEGVTGPNGHYSLEVHSDHGDDICEISAVKSPRPDCSVPMGFIEKSKVVLTANDGMHAGVRFANPLGFQTKTAIPQCGPVLFSLGVLVGQ